MLRGQRRSKRQRANGFAGEEARCLIAPSWTLQSMSMRSMLAIWVGSRRIVFKPNSGQVERGVARWSCSTRPRPGLQRSRGPDPRAGAAYRPASRPPPARPATAAVQLHLRAGPPGRRRPAHAARQPQHGGHGGLLSRCESGFSTLSGSTSATPAPPRPARQPKPAEAASKRPLGKSRCAPPGPPPKLMVLPALDSPARPLLKTPGDHP